MINRKTIILLYLIGFLISSANAQTKKSQINGAEKTGLKLGNEKVIVKDGIVAISNWPAYNTYASEMEILKKASKKKSKRIIERMGITVALLDDTKPTWMNTKRVNKIVKAVQKEYREVFDNNTNYTEASKLLLNKYEKLQYETSQVVSKYVKTNNTNDKELFRYAVEE